MSLVDDALCERGMQSRYVSSIERALMGLVVAIRRRQRIAAVI
jgi:hypothetical protein